MSLKVAVLMGGQSLEREFSLLSGKNVCDLLSKAGHEVVPLDTTSDLVSSLRDEKVDVAYIALHGKHGEDGTIQSLLDLLEIPFVGSTAPVCRITRNKANVGHVIEQYRKNSGKSGNRSWADGICLSIDAFKEMGAADALDKLTQRFGGNFPLVVKPARGGSAMGLHKVDSREDLAEAIMDALSYDDSVIVGEWIDGVELAVSIVDDAQGNPQILPAVEISTSNDYFDTANRLSADGVHFYSPPRDESLEACVKTANQSMSAQEASEIIANTALEAYTAFGCRDMARVDMIFDGQCARILELDVSPGMSSRSLFPSACEAAGIKMEDLLSQLLERAVKRCS